MDRFFLVSILVIVLNYIGEVTIMCRCVPEKRRKMHVWGIRTVKLIGINLFYDVVFPYFFPQVSFLRVSKAWVDAFAMVIAILLVKIAMRMTWGRVGIIFLAADLRAFVCTMLPVFISSNMQGKTIQELTVSMTNADILGCTTATIILLLLTRKYSSRFCIWMQEREIENDITWTVLFFFYYICQFFLTISGIRTADGKLSYSVTWTMSLLIFGCLFYLFMMQKQAQYLRLKNENLDMQKKMMEEYQRATLEQIDLTKKYRHDIENHMQTIATILSTEQNQNQHALAYLDALKEQQKEQLPLKYCDNLVINSAIANKVQLCKEKEIEVSVDFKGLDLGQISEIDFLSILFNVFDNAIECCEKQNDIGMRSIEIKCYAKMGQLVLFSKNKCYDLGEGNQVIFETAKEYDFSDISTISFLKTTKNTDQLHGVGMKIVAEIIKKYSGDMDIRCANGLFTVRINIPNQK